MECLLVFLGRWTCPWHHCDECGKQSVRLCHECPNSFCSQHSENNIYTVDGREVCSDHEDLLLGVVTSYANGPTKSEKGKTLANGMHPSTEKMILSNENGSLNEMNSERTVENNSTKFESALIEKPKTDKTKLITTNGENKSKLLGKRGRRMRDDKRQAKLLSCRDITGEDGIGFNSNPIGPVDGKKMDNDSLAIPPMFDDSDEEFPDLVIDLPQL